MFNGVRSSLLDRTIGGVEAQNRNRNQFAQKFEEIAFAGSDLRSHQEKGVGSGHLFTIALWGLKNTDLLGRIALYLLEFFYPP